MTIDHVPLPRLTGARQVSDRPVRTFCNECTQCCGLLAYVRDGCIVEVQGDESHPISRGRLCAKGQAFIQGLRHPERLTRAAFRSHPEEPFQEAQDWDSTLDHLGERLKRIRDRYGPESLVIGCDPEAGLDFHMGALRFARLWGTPYVHHPLEEEEDSTWPPVLNKPDRPCSEWAHGGGLFLIEADLASTHPVAFQWVLEARKRGVRIIAADARFTPSMAKADRAVHIAPASGNDLGLALIKHLLEVRAMAQDGLNARLTNAGPWKEALDRCSGADLEKATLVMEPKVEELARMLIQNGPVTLITGKRLAFRPNYHVWRVLSDLMGWSENGAGGWYPMESGQPPLDPARDISSPETEAEIKRGDFSYQFAHESEPEYLHPIKAVIATGNCLEDFLSPYQALLGHVDLTAFFGSFPNATWKKSQVVLPAAFWPEREGLVFSQDRAVCWCGSLVAPRSDCRSGLDFWVGLAQRMGWEKYFPWVREDGRADPHAFWGWLLDQGPQLQGGTLTRVQKALEDSEPLYWPLTEDGRSPERVLPPDGRFTPGLPKLSPDPEKDVLQNYPLHFQATRLVTRSGEASRWWPWTRDLEDEKAVQLHPDTAAALGLENGDEVVVRGPRNSLTGRLWLNRMTPRWLVWSPQRLGEKRVLIHKAGADADADANEALQKAKGLL